ncbi:MAG: MFS transporter [Rhodocyclaceae bacterium]|jgi:predicted MFS family arabinose efflux permease|nr:MFS transporter [Rhodocyclaceae bacterium]
MGPVDLARLAPRLRRLRNIALILAIGAYLLSFFHRVAPAAIARDLAASFQTSAASLGVLAATYFYVYTVMQIPTGVLADTLGPRKILTLGGIVAGAGSLLFGLAPSFEIAVIGRTLVGLGVSVAFIAMLKLIAVWFEESRFATLTGAAMFIGNIGSVTAGAPLAWAAQAAGWRSVFVVVGVLSLAIGLLSWFYVRDHPVEASAGQRAGAVRVDRTAWLSGLGAVMKNPATWPGFFVNLGIAGSFFAFAGLWAVPYLTQVHGMTRGVASNHISVYFIGFAIGCAVIGRLSDGMGRRKPIMVAGAVLHALGWLVWIFGGPLPLAVTYGVCGVMGLVTASLTLSWACAKEVNPPLLSGMATSVVNVGVFLGPAILQPLVGRAMDSSWQGAMEGGARLYTAADYRTGLLLLAGFAALGAVSTLFVRETNCRNIWRGKPSSLK